MNNTPRGNDNETSAYILFSAVIILIFIGVLIFVLMTAAGYDFGFEVPPVSVTETDSLPISETITSNELPPIETAPVTEVLTDITETTQTELISDPYLNETPRELPVFEVSPYEDTYPDTVLCSTDDMGREYLDKITFLGDSTTYGLIRYAMLRDGKQTKQVWTPLSGTLTLSQAGIAKIYYPDDDEEITISKAVQRKAPEILIITLGVNGVSFMKKEYFIGEYDKLIKSIQENSPDTKIILQSILPVARSYANQEQINNEKISAANSWIVELAAQNGVKYLDTITSLIGDDGYLPEEYQNGDGMHLNEVSFQIELDYIRTHALT